MLPITIFRRKLFSPVLMLATAASLWLGAVAQADDYATYIQQYGERTLPVGLRIPGGQQDWFLSKMNGPMLEISLANGDSMAFDATDESLANRLVLRTPAQTQIATLVKDGNTAEALALLRPEVYPLLRFRTLSAAYSQFFEPIDLLLGTLVASGNFVEAAEILGNNTELLVQERFQRRVLGLIEALLQDGKSAEAVKMLTLIPLESVPEGLKNALMDFAYRLRVRGEYDSLISVYRQLIPLLEGIQKTEAEIWLAYCLINTGNQTEGEEILKQMEKPEPSDDSFGLYQLLSGYNLLRTGEHAEALDIFSRGLVYASSVDVWIPEITYYIGNCYRNLDKLDTARNAYEEIFKLYPENIWAKRAKTAYDEIVAGIAVEDSAVVVPAGVVTVSVEEEAAEAPVDEGASSPQAPASAEASGTQRAPDSSSSSPAGDNSGDDEASRISEGDDA